MKLRNGFVSNSSSSSFIIDDKFSKEEILSFVKGLLIGRGSERLWNLSQKKPSLCLPSREYEEKAKVWKEEYNRIQSDYTKETLDKVVAVKKLSEWDEDDFDLTEYYNLDKINPSSWVLYDTDSNYLNWSTDEIIEYFNCKNYCEHM